MGLFQSGVIKDRRKRCATAVGERVATVLAIVHDESTMAIDCIACARILTAAWSTPSTQNRIMRSCAVSFVVAFAMGYSRRHDFANAATASSHVASSPCAARRMWPLWLLAHIQVRS